MLQRWSWWVSRRCVTAYHDYHPGTCCSNGVIIWAMVTMVTNPVRVAAHIPQIPTNSTAVKPGVTSVTGAPYRVRCG